MSQDMIERKKRLIGKRSDRNQELWFGVFLFFIGLLFIPIIIGIFPLLLGLALIIYGWEGKSKIDQELVEIDSKIDRQVPHGHESTPLEILKKRYAKGEITKKEYEYMKKDLN